MRKINIDFKSHFPHKVGYYVSKFIIIQSQASEASMHKN